MDAQTRLLEGPLAVMILPSTPDVKSWVVGAVVAYFLARSLAQVQLPDQTALMHTPKYLGMRCSQN